MVVNSDAIKTTMKEQAVQASVEGISGQLASLETSTKDELAGLRRECWLMFNLLDTNMDKTMKNVDITMKQNAVILQMMQRIMPVGMVSSGMISWT